MGPFFDQTLCLDHSCACEMRRYLWDATCAGKNEKSAVLSLRGGCSPTKQSSQT